VPRISFFFNAHNDFFEEIAKYRAARVVWAKTMKERFGAKNPRTMQMRFHTQTAGVSLTVQQPLNNIARVAIQALAGVLGGTQSLHTDSYDEALALPTDQAALIALRTQQIIAEETGVVNTVDPLGGSFYVEALTQKMVDGCFDYFDKIKRRSNAKNKSSSASTNMRWTSSCTKPTFCKSTKTSATISSRVCMKPKPVVTTARFRTSWKNSKKRREPMKI
jgi:methylmalonyl-CoA mutase cobalamin-binding domain/chain